MKTNKRQILRAASALWLGSTGLARAHGNEDHPKKLATLRKEQKDWGIAGDPKAVRRRIEVRMDDNMRFTPERLDFRLGDTVQFRVRNAGKVMHEFVIGTRVENAKHAELMLKFPNMEHDEPHMAHVPPGKSAEIVWTFNRAGTFEFACLIGGHYASGMVGSITVRA